MSLPEPQPKPKQELNLRFLIPVIGGALAYVVVAWPIEVCWNQAFGSLYQLSFSGALGIEGVLWIIVAMFITGYLVAVRDWGE